MIIVLGSTSPRRQELMGHYFPAFQICAPHINEDSLPGESSLEYATRISENKTAELIGRLSTSEDYLLITGDTIVSLDGSIIGKPADRNNALEILRTLRGRTHEVISALTLTYNNHQAKTITDREITRVTFKNLSDDQLKEYLDRIEYLDKAGAYAIQEHGDFIVEEIFGSLTNVIGFPLRLFFRLMSSLNLLDIMFRD